MTRFYLLTRPVRSMYQSLYIYPVSEYRSVLRWVVDVCTSQRLLRDPVTDTWQACPAADPDTEMVALSLYPPGQEDMCILANFTTFKDTREEGEWALQPLHDSRPPNARVEIFCQSTSLAQEYCAQDEANPQGHRYCSDNAYIHNGEDVVAVLEQAFTTLPNRKTTALYFAMDPTSRRAHYRDNAGDKGMALSMQSDHYFALYAVWEDQADDTACAGWVHSIMRDVERYAAGSYLGDADFQHRRPRFWADENAQRLMEIRRRWDPEVRICGYLDDGDRSGVDGLTSEAECR